MRTWKVGLRIILFSIVSVYFLYGNASPVFSTDTHQVLEPRVPADKLAAVKVLKNTTPNSEKSVLKGKTIYNGKGTCVNCHGKEGKGDGPLAGSFDPRPRDFYDADDIGWQKVRTDGEIFWAISKGTEKGMIAFEDMLSEEEIWAVVNYIRELGKSSVQAHELAENK